MNDLEAYYKDKTDTWKQDALGFENYNKKGVEAPKGISIIHLYILRKLVVIWVEL